MRGRVVGCSGEVSLSCPAEAVSARETRGVAGPTPGFPGRPLRVPQGLRSQRPTASGECGPSGTGWQNGLTKEE